MTNSKTTKKALYSSVLAVVLCVAMLVGTTFAWFTDTASTSVNKIQAGKLDVALEMLETNADGVATWVTAEGKTLNFKAADNRTDILWEPGCTYELPKLRIVNKGDLALKYTVKITGINGDAKLNEAIEWDMAGTEDGQLLPEANKEFTIKGHMNEEAGNEYQGLSIEGIAITVYATQLASEQDSFGSDYDASATYPAASLPATIVDGEEVITEDVVLTTVGENPVKVVVNRRLLETIYNNGSVTKLSLKHDGMAVDAANNTVKFKNLEVVDQNGNVVDLTGNTSMKLTVTLPAVGIADGTTVKVFHDGNQVCMTSVQDGKINYSVYHLCDVEVKPAADGERNTFAPTVSTNDKNTGTKYKSVTETVTSADIVHTYENTTTTGNAIALWNGADVTFNDVNVTATSENEQRNPVIYVRNGVSLTINSGTYKANGPKNQMILLIHGDGEKASTVTINGGNFISNSTDGLLLAYSNGTKIIINGGFFDQSEGNANLTLQDRYGRITVTGGTFVNYDPSVHRNSNGTAYVAPGYHVESETQANGKVWYTVKKDK